MKRILMRSTWLLCGALLLNGCRKDLCYDHDLHGLGVQVHVQPEWECVWEYDHGMSWVDNWDAELYNREYEELHPEQATGIAAFVYNGDGTRTERHLPDEGGLLPMTEGPKSILFYNDDTSYIVFGNLDSWASATASTRTRTRATYTQRQRTDGQCARCALLGAYRAVRGRADRRTRAPARAPTAAGLHLSGPL